MSGRLLVCVENRRKGRSYVRALRAAGAELEQIEVVTPRTAPRDVVERAAQAAGVLMCGGPDVDPRRYGEAPLETAGLALHPALDELEWQVLAGARRHRVPVWAICRGMQTLNVFLGGSLFQDLHLQLGEVLKHDVPRPLDYLAHDLPRRRGDSRFAGHLQSGPLRVNSRHHQAIKELAPGLEPLAWAGDGVLEVVEGADPDWWLRGVQWHPEDLVGLPLQRRLWTDFLDLAAERAAERRPRLRAGGGVR